MFSGSFVAIVTPFKNGRVDYDKLKELIEMHIEKGTSGIVPCGTTGESATLSHDEHNDVVKNTVKVVKGRVKVIAGTGSNSTREAIELTKFAERVGVDGSLIITPYYNKPTQKGLYEHFAKIASEVDIPIIVYNVPGRTAVDILPQTVIKLSRIKNVIGIKEASGQLGYVSEIVRGTDGKFDVLSGDDALTFPMLAIGGKGAISVVANIVPEDVANMIRSFEEGNIDKARKLHLKMFPLIKALFMETNPIPVKTAMEILGMMHGELRLPLCEMSEENKSQLKKVMKEYGLIK